MDITLDSELTLSIGSQRVVVSPWGASLRRYSVTEADGKETDIVWGYSGGAHKKGGQGDVLIPFPGRVAEGRYSFDGQHFPTRTKRQGRTERDPWICQNLALEGP